MKNIYFNSNEFALKKNKKLVFIFVLGAINRYTSDKFEAFYQVLLKKNIIIAISLLNVDYIDSTGLGVLANFQQRCKDISIELNLISLSPKIQHLFEMLGMSSFFEIYQSNIDFLQHFQKNSLLNNNINYYLEKIDKINGNIIEHNETKQKNKEIKKIKEIKPPVFELQYPQYLHIKKIDFFFIKIKWNDSLANLQLIPSLDGCIIQPSHFYLSKNKNDVCFSIVPIAPQKDAILKIDIFFDQHRQYKFPIKIKKNRDKYLLLISVFLVIINTYTINFFNLTLVSLTALLLGSVLYSEWMKQHVKIIKYVAYLWVSKKMEKK